MALTIEHNVSLRTLNSFGVEAQARYLVRVHTLEDLQRIADAPLLRDVPRVVLGGGSNTLFTGDVDGVVLKMELQGLRELAGDDQAFHIEVGAGENWHGTVEQLMARARPGLENLALIPGSTGAAPIQNIGAYGLELAERLHSVQAWDFEQAQQRVLSLSDCGFGYRDSVFKHDPMRHLAVISVTLALPRHWQPVTGYAEVKNELAARAIDQPSPQDVFDAVVAIRRRKLPDPMQIGNAGSFFKNPIVSRAKRSELIAKFPSLVSYALPGARFKLAAGWLIDAAGLKGATRGRAGVYEKQALVLVNRGGASGGEILALAREIQDKVMEKFGVQLEPEPVII